jgi:hypothetical protein
LHLAKEADRDATVKKVMSHYHPRSGVKPSEQLGSFRMASKNGGKLRANITAKPSVADSRPTRKESLRCRAPMAPGQNVSADYLSKYLAKRLLYELAVKAEKDLC